MEDLELNNLEKIKKLANTKINDISFCHKIASDIFISWVVQKTNESFGLDVEEAQDLAISAFEYANIFIEEMVCPDQELISYVDWKTSKKAKIPENS
jgi:hypothetical protein